MKNNIKVHGVVYSKDTTILDFPSICVALKISSKLLSLGGKKSTIRLNAFYNAQNKRLSKL